MKSHPASMQLHCTRMLMLLCYVAYSAAITITDDSPTQASQLMYGQMYEDINHSGDGGLYGELLVNRAFQGSIPSLEGYRPLDADSMLALSPERPLSDALKTVLKLTTKNSTAGFVNTGYNGFAVARTKHYDVSVYATFTRPLGIAVPSIIATIRDSNGRVVGSTSLGRSQINSTLYPSTSNTFARYTGEIQALSTDPQCTFELSVELDPGESAYFSLVSLFPETHDDHDTGGVRKDLFDTMKHLQPSFFRFPGGNNLQGSAIASRWKWNETIGPITGRAGGDGAWRYANTNGMGLLEWFAFVEKDLNATPVLGVYAGYSLDRESVPREALQPYIDDVLNELEYIKGDASTKFGALRASHGRLEPFALDHVEIGNEDFLSKDGQDSYRYRLLAFATAIRASYPNMTLISTWDGLPFPTNTWSDEHYYPSPDGLVSLFNKYDKYAADRKILVGEYACRTFNNGSIMEWPTVLAAVAEAVFAIGAERNTHIVQGLAYAPLLANESPGEQKLVQWRPNMISFTTDRVILSTSYMIQKLLSTYRLEQVYQIQDAQYDPLYYVAGRAKTGSLILKIANPKAQTQQFIFSIRVKDLLPSKVFAEGISGDPLAFNDLQHQPIQFREFKTDLKNGTVSIELPAYSFVVLSVSE